MSFKKLLILALLLVVSTTVQAQRFNKKNVYDDLRHGQWEASLLVQGAGGVDLGGESGSSIEVDDTIGWGFTIGYNLTANWNFSVSLHR